MAQNQHEGQVPQLNLLVVILVAAVLGFISIACVPYIIPGKKIVFYEGGLFPFIQTAIENLSILPTASLLVVSGGIVGYLKPERWMLLGFSTIVPFPIASVLEMILYPTSHNLWPIEFLMYCVLSIPPVLGAFIGSRLKKIITAR